MGSKNNIVSREKNNIFPSVNSAIGNNYIEENSDQSNESEKSFSNKVYLNSRNDTGTRFMVTNEMGFDFIIGKNTSLVEAF